MSKSEVFNEDCMICMHRYPDKYFDLAVVDPPYGIEKGFSATSRIQKYGQMQTVNDKKPTPEYFKELFRVSKNQIIWGYNHLSDMLPTTKEFIFWYKHQPVESYSDGELAWTSFKKTAKCFDYPFFGGNGRRQRRQNPPHTKTSCLVHLDSAELCQTGRQDSGHPFGKWFEPDRRV